MNPSFARRFHRMSRRIVVGLTLAVLGGARGASADDTRRNILFVFADDWGRYASCYRGLDGRPTVNDVVRTPNIDRVAREGVVFRHAFVAFPDMDAGPTKTWLVARWRDPVWQWHVDLAFAKRPAEEFYDLKDDPDQVKNLAADPAWAAKKRELSERMMTLLRAAQDPRVVGDGMTFERSPYTDPEPPVAPKPAAKPTAK